MAKANLPTVTIFDERGRRRRYRVDAHGLVTGARRTVDPPDRRQIDLAKRVMELFPVPKLKTARTSSYTLKHHIERLLGTTSATVP